MPNTEVTGVSLKRPTPLVLIDLSTASFLLPTLSASNDNISLVCNTSAVIRGGSRNSHNKSRKTHGIENNLVWLGVIGCRFNNSNGRNSGSGFRISNKGGTYPLRVDISIFVKISEIEIKIGLKDWSTQ